MKLYHGTAFSNKKSILKDGIWPRGKVFKSNWEHSVPSRPDCVYMSRVYAPYFAFQATPNEGSVMVVEIEVDRLNEENLWPDEDCLEQGTRNLPNAILKGHPMKERTKYFRDNLHHFQEYWEDSVNTMGTCAYHGVIPPESITRTATFRLKDNPFLIGVLDPSITILNYALCGEKYRILNDWLFDGPNEETLERDAQYIVMGGSFSLADLKPIEGTKVGDFVENQMRESIERMMAYLRNWNVGVTSY